MKTKRKGLLAASLMRREYLRKKRQACTAALVMILLAIYPLSCSVSVLVPTIRDFSPNHHFGDSVLGFEIAAFLIMIAIAALVIGGWQVKTAVKIPYVPPVHKQLAILPAEEVLLRGSQITTASLEELLRPAASQEASAEELLRPIRD